MDLKKILRETWSFIWNDDSLLSWIVNVVLAFVLVKFIIYPGIGLLLGTGYPVVAVVSCSMEHNAGVGSCSFSHFRFDNWFNEQKDVYTKFDIDKEKFYNYRFANGLNKGDLVVITGYGGVKQGDVIVFRGAERDPLIHRVIRIVKNDKGNIVYHTMGDNNKGSRPDEFDISNERYIGKAVFRIPYLGWVKIIFNSLIKTQAF